MDNVVVRKSSMEVVRPQESVTTTTYINLSAYDKLVVSIPVTTFLVFDRPIHEPTQTIKRALSKALVHYLPICGRLGAGPGQGDLHIAINGEGIYLVAATASCVLQDVKFIDHSTKLVDELAIYYPQGLCGLNDPLLMMQVTEFSCGGFVVGVTWNHVIADAAGIGQFLQAVGELARGLSLPSVIPIRCGDFLAEVPPSPHGLVELMLSPRLSDKAILDITIPSTIIRSIMEDFTVYSSGRSCTTFEAVTAMLWQCRTRTIASKPEDPVAIFFAMNMRKYIGARDGYYGNCALGRLVMASTEEVANGDLMDLVEMIQRAKSQTADEFKKGAHGDVPHVGNLDGYNLLTVTSWWNLGLEDVDFGGGRPARVTAYNKQLVSGPAFVALVPYQGSDGSNMVSACVRKQHADAFLRELSSRLNGIIWLYLSSLAVGFLPRSVIFIKRSCSGFSYQNLF